MTNPTIDVWSEKSIASLNMSVIMIVMMTLPLFKIKIDQNQVPLDKDGELSQLLGLAKSEDQKDGVRW